MTVNGKETAEGDEEVRTTATPQQPVQQQIIEEETIARGGGTNGKNV